MEALEQAGAGAEPLAGGRQASSAGSHAACRTKARVEDDHHAGQGVVGVAEVGPAPEAVKPVSTRAMPIKPK